MHRVTENAWKKHKRIYIKTGIKEMRPDFLRRPARFMYIPKPCIFEASGSSLYKQRKTDIEKYGSGKSDGGVGLWIEKRFFLI